MTWSLFYYGALFNFNQIGLGLEIGQIGFRDSLRIRDFFQLEI